MEMIDVGGFSLHASVQGPEDAPTLVLINSLGTDFRTWDPLLPLLPGDLRVLRYDKRGHGLSDDPDDDRGMESRAVDLERLLDRLRIQRAALVGLSVGGQIALSLAGRRPDLVSRLALMDTAARIGTPEMWSARMAGVEAGGLAAIADDVLARWFTAAFRHSDPRFPRYRNMLLRTPAQGYLRTCAAIRDADCREQARGLRLPVLAMAGSEDRSTPPELVRETAALIDGARFLEIPAAGHLPMVERPGEVAAALLPFLAETTNV